jgi:ribosomal protein L37AE/L43A
MERFERTQRSALFTYLPAPVESRMATTERSVTDRTEDCADCGRETPHRVTVQILTESAKQQNAEFSREPYRVSTCRVCGATTETRMNNA